MDDNAAVNQEAAQIIKLQQKLALAEQEVKDMANKLTKMSEAVDQAREEFMAKENKLIGRMKELEKNLDAYSERAKCELEEQRMKMELEKLRELETLRSKFDLEREQHRLERQKDAALIAKLILALEPKRGECPRFDTEKLVETSEGGNSPTYPSESAVSKSLTIKSTPRNNDIIFVDGVDIPGNSIHISEAEDILKDTESEIKSQVIQMFTPHLVSAVSYSVYSVADHCLSKGLISVECYESATEVGDKAAKAGHLLEAVKSAIEIKHPCFGLFLDSVLDEALAPEVASELIKNMKEQVDTRQQNYQDNKIVSLLRRQHPSCSMVREPEIIRFRGYLASTGFLRIDEDFQIAIHAGQVENVESAVEEMSKRNQDYRAIGLLYRASCRVVITGKVNEALADCDRAIEVAKSLECQNGVLITLRALRMKVSILRTVGQLEKAADCLQTARGFFSIVAPSYDSVAFLYEEIRLKMRIADRITYSDAQVDYDRALKHLDYSNENDIPLLFIVRNSEAEVLLKSSMIRDEGRLSPAPTEQDLNKAEKILNNLPINQLPEEAYVYRGWHYLARSDLYTWRKQYAEAKEWAKKSLKQFEKGQISYAAKVSQKRLELLKRLELPSKN